MTTRLHRTARRAAHTALLSLALVTGAASAATAGTIAPVGLNKALQDLSTMASPDVTIGGAIFDTATVSGVETGVEGSLLFELYGPNNAMCTGTPIFNPTVETSGSGNFASGNFVPTAPGTYRWIVRFRIGTETIVSGCNVAGEDTDVLQATPRVRTLASDDVPLGEEIFDRARLTGGYQPTGTITFSLYNPQDSECSEVAVTTSTRTVTGNGPYRSAPFEPTVPGTYRWRADYSGDVNNAPAGTACNDPLEQVTVRAVPTLTTNVTDPEVELTEAVSDTATLTGGLRATGTIVFTLYGPNDEDCSTEPVFTSDPVTVTPDETDYESGDFTPETAGTYQWIATYSGDANNEEVATGCGDPNETVVVRGDQVTPTLTTRVSRGTTFVGKPVTDIASLSGGDNPTGTITFNLYGPGDATCSRTPVFTSVVDVEGNDDYTSGEFRPRVPGTYQWVAEYSGDENNAGVVTACDDPAERFIVKRKPPYGGVPRP